MIPVIPAPMGDFQPGEIIDIQCGWGGAAAQASGWSDPAHARQTLRARGVRWAFVVSEAARHFDTVAGNEEIEALTSARPELRGWLVAHPSRAQEAHAQMRQHLYDARWIGCALYPDPLTGRPVTLEDFHDIINAYRRFGKPLYIGTPDADAARHAAAIARDTGNMRVILGGMGGSDWREVIDLCAQLTNLCVDISGVLVPEKIDYAITALHGARKILFASNAPHTDPAAVIGLLDDLDLSELDRNRILGGNAARLFHLDEIVETAGPDLRPFGAAENAVVEEETPHLETIAADEEPAA